MNKIFSKILSTVTAFVVTIFVSSGSLKTVVNEITVQAVTSNVIYGDIDHNNVIDPFDIVNMRKLLCNSENEMIEADLNGNNVIDTNDLYLLQSYVIGEINEFPVSYLNKVKDADSTIIYSNPIEQSITNEMKALANSLKTPEKIYEYVLNNTKIDFYPDSRKGAIGTYEQNCGNDIDCASLLIAMYNCIGIKSKYVNVTMTISFDEAINITGANNINSAYRILSFRDPEISYDINAKTISLKHTLVNSIINGKEYYLDCSFKSYTYHDSLFDDINSRYNLTDCFEITNVNYMYNDAEKYYKGSYNLCDKQIISQHISSLPNTLSFKYDIIQSYEAISNNDSDLITFCIGSNNCTYKSVELYNKKITIEYEISDDLIECKEGYLSDIQEGENIYQLLNNMSKDAMLPGKMQPVLKIDGEKIASGGTISIGKIQNIPIIVKTFGYESKYYKECCVGSMYSIVIDYQNMSPCRMVDDISSIANLSSSVSNNNLYSDTYLGEMLNYIGDLYFCELDLTHDMIAEQSNIYCIRGLSIAAVGFEPDLSPNISILGMNIPYSEAIEEAGRFSIDILYDNYVSISRTEDYEKEKLFSLAANYSSSQLESSIIEQIFGIDAVSTTKILEYALHSGINIITLYSENADKVSTLEINDDAKSLITQYLEQTDYIITVPEKDIKIGSWEGTGYIIYDPVSGGSLFQLTKKTTTNGGASSNNVQFRDVCAAFFSSSFIIGSASALFKAVGAFSLGGPLIIAASLLKLTLAAASVILSYVNLLYTYDLIGKAANGDVKAKTELDLYNITDLTMTGIAICPAVVNRLSSAFNGISQEARYMNKYGSEAVEGAIKHSDDLPKAFKTADELTDLAIDTEAAKKALKYGDTFISDFETIVIKESELTNIINSASDKEKAMFYLTKYGDIAVADYLEVGVDGIDMLIDNISKMPDDMTNVWGLRSTVRGKYIERAVAATEYKTWFYIGNECNGYYPVIDFQKDTTIVSFKTMNPSSYSETARISKIDEYAEALGNFVQYHGNDLCNNKVLDIRVPPGTSDMIDESAIDIIENQYNIKIKIGEFE